MLKKGTCPQFFQSLEDEGVCFLPFPTPLYWNAFPLTVLSVQEASGFVDLMTVIPHPPPPQSLMLIRERKEERA